MNFISGITCTVTLLYIYVLNFIRFPFSVFLTFSAIAVLFQSYLSIALYFIPLLAVFFFDVDVQNVYTNLPERQPTLGCFQCRNLHFSVRFLYSFVQFNQQA